jgi:hypothetical protein
MIIHVAKLSLHQALEAHRVMRRRGSQILQVIGSKMAVRFLALRRSWQPYTPRRFLVLISVRG